MFCPNCGAKNPDGAHFCRNCGCALNDSFQPAQVRSDPERTDRAAEPEASKPKKRDWGCLIGALFCLALGIMNIYDKGHSGTYFVVFGFLPVEYLLIPGAIALFYFFIKND